MNKHLISILIITVFICSCKKDTEISSSQADYFLKVFGGSLTDSINAVSKSGDEYYLTGTIQKDLVLIKTDKYGNEVDWSPKFYGNDKEDVGCDLTLDQDNNVIAAGYSVNSGRQTDAFIVKTSPNGEEMWSRRLGGDKDEKIYAVYSSANEIYVAGYTESINASIKGRQGWLLVLSQNGDSIWSHDYGIIGVSDELHDIIALNNDYLLLVGTTQSLIEAGKTDVFIFIIRKSTRGIENFVTLFKTGKEKGIKALRAPTGEIFILGTSQISDNKNNIYIWKISEDLSVIQEKQISATISETPSDIIYENGSLIIIGTAFNEQSNEDVLVYALDNNFNILSRNTFGSRDNQKGISGVISNRNVIIGGSVYSKGTSKASLFKTPEILP